MLNHLKHLILATLLFSFAGAQDDIRAGFIYVGPIGDYGWTHAHDEGRRIVEEELGISTVYVESVAEAETEAFIDQLVRQGANVIFATSFGFGEGAFAAAERYPNVIFAHATGYMRAPNLATYTAEFYQVYYLNGLIAGALTETGRVGYVAAVPIPEVKRHINAFAMGVQAVNPDAVVDVRWIFEWFNPGAATEATQALIAAGADVFAFTEDTPTVIQVAAEAGFPSFGHYSPMQQFAPDYVASGQLVHWDRLYLDFLSRVQSGEFTSENLEDVDYWWLLDSGAVELGGEAGVPINPVFEERLRAVMVETDDLGSISVYDLVMTRLEQMSQPEVAFEPFTGPLADRRGNVIAEAGVVLSVEELNLIQWAADNVVGPWPDEP